METENKDKIEENFKELLSEVAKIGELIDEVEDIGGEEATENEKNESQPSTSSITTQTEKVNDENLEEYVYNSATSLINNSLFTLEKVKKSVNSVMDFRELTALAELIKATTSSIDVLNKVVMENKKLKNAREIKKMDIEAKKELGTTKIKNQTNILVASREEALKQLVENSISADTFIDVEGKDASAN